MIPFNKPFLTGKETQYIEQAVQTGKISGNGIFTQKCQSYFESRYGFKKCLLTTSCTDALEMAAILADIHPGDEVIIPAYTFVSTANAFVLRGANIVFADSESTRPHINATNLEELITDKTKAIIVVHYAGMACDMDQIMAIADKNNLLVIEDAAQAIDSYYKEKPLGSIGHMATFSFHETKNIISGEGGMLVINDDRFVDRSEIIWEKGTNRAAFFRGEVDKYGWVDVGSSFLPSEVIAAFLYAQLENLDRIQQRRKEIWDQYYSGLTPLARDGFIELPVIANYATNNAHMFYVVCKSLKERTELISHLKTNSVHAVFHYLSLHKSPYYKNSYKGSELNNSEKFTEQLVRLPLFYELSDKSIQHIIQSVKDFYIH
jgi:dTDP-4-amino-4,6-dideoxygalactose transaminase